MGETRRLRALRDLRVLDTKAEQVFDDLTHVAALVCRVPISLVTLVDHDRQWLKANIGLPGVTETPREVAFCDHTIRDDSLFEIRDATRDPRFADNPLVTGSPDIRFYAGAPLQLSDGTRVGALCVIDNEPRELEPWQREALSRLSEAVCRTLEYRRVALEHSESEARFLALSEAFPLGVFASDAEGVCTYVNEGWEAIMGLGEAEATGHGWFRALHPDDREAVFDGWRRTATERLDLDMTFRVVRGDGSLVHVRALSRPIYGDDGELTGHVGSFVDITESELQLARLRRSEWLLNETGAMASVGGWEFDITTGTLLWSEQTCRIHGLEPGYQPGIEAAIEFYAPESRPAIEAAVSRAMATGEGWDLELQLVRADGRTIWARAIGYAEMVDGQAARLLGAFQDVTERVVQRQALERAHERIGDDVKVLRALSGELDEQRELLDVTLHSITDAVITTDASGRITWLNPVAEQLTGHASADSRGQQLVEVFRIVDGATEQAVPDPVTACLRGDDTSGMIDDIVLVSKADKRIHIEHSAAPIRKQDARPLGVVLVFRDVSERRRLSAEMNHRATHDALTGLINRREFEARLERTLTEATEDSGDGTLMYIDLDNFKIVNDTCGHAVGDRLLQEITDLIEGSVRTSDTVARIGGDEFAVILPRCELSPAQRVGQQICDRMSEFRFVHDGRRFRVGTSIGVAPVDGRWSGIPELMQAADSACYGAKQAGRNRVVIWVDSDDSLERQGRQTRWATRLEEALDDDAFELHAQRIEALSKPRGPLQAEVLVRLRDAGGELVAPGLFLPAAERFHLAARIDRWVLRRVIDHLRSVPSSSHPSMLCVNVSGQSIGDRAFHRDAIKMLSDAGDAICRRLCLEITETAAVTSMEDAALFAERVRAMGLRIALDDFGAGASSFGYLKTLPVDVLKIDGQFIQSMLDEPLDEAAVHGFVHVARVMGVCTVAEHVDRPEILERVRELGIDFAQGFLLHRPEPLARLFGDFDAESGGEILRRAS